MSGSYPPPAPKRLTRSSSNKMIGGVCAGVANYLNMDPTLVRVLTVLLTLFTGVPVIVYLVALFVMPEDHAPAGSSYPPGGPTPSGQPGPAAHPPASSSDPVWGTAGAPWEQPAQPAPSTVSDPKPPAPSDPEAPVVPPQDGTDSGTDPGRPTS